MDSLRTACIIGAALSAGLVGCSSSNKAASSSPADSGPTSGNCVPADINPCTSYTFPTEDGGTTTLQLGPYGAQVDPNIGAAFPNTIDSSQQPGSAYCKTFADLFHETAPLTNLLLETTMNGITINFALYSAYRPATWPSTPVPVITWANGTCAQPEGYGALLRYVASYGYFIIAANTVQTGTNNPDGGQPMLNALDYAASANADPTSPYYQKLDLTKIGAMGHSQGGTATAVASADPRIKYVIDFNLVDMSSNESSSGIAKPYLAVSATDDVTGFTASSMSSAIDGAGMPAAYLFYLDPVGAAADPLKGHLVIMLTPERVTSQTVAWWQMWFRNDAPSKADFVGPDCGFCNQGDSGTNPYDYGANALLEGDAGASTDQ